MANEAITSDFTTRPWWWEAAQPWPSESPGLPESPEILVVGAGYTGLSAALTLSEAGRRVLVVDRLMPGEAASSRNAGFVGRSLLGGFSRMAERLGVDETVRLHRGAEDAYDYVVGLMKRLAIDCHLSDRGRLIPVWNQTQYAEVAADFERQQKHLRVEGAMLSAEELAQELRVSGAHGALLIANTSSVHPGMYHAGLRRAVEEAGAQVAGGCAVEQIAREGKAFRVRTSRGTIRAGEVVIATNAHTGGVTPWLRRRLVRSTACMTACEPRDPALLKSLIPGDRTYVDYSRYQFNFWRIAPDAPNRLLFGGQTGLLYKRPEEIARLLQADLARVFPELAGTRFSHLWQGEVAFTMDRLPHLGVHEGVHFALGCNAAGLPMGTYIGHKIALRLLGDPASDTPYDDRRFPISPSILGFPWFMPVLTTWARWQDWRGAAARGH